MVGRWFKRLSSSFKRSPEVGLGRPAGDKPRRPFIVEDDQTVREVLVAMLTNMGHTVVACEERAAALAVLERESFDLALIGLSLPGIGGWQLIETIKGQWLRMPVVVVTDLAEPAKPPSRQALIDGFLQKPFGYEQLNRILSSVLPLGRTEGLM